MKNRVKSLLCAVTFMVAWAGAFGADKPSDAKGGPIFTIPKTVVTLDLQIDKTVMTPGTNCEFLDLFFPGLDPAVPCNGNLLPPLKLEPKKPPSIDEGLLGLSNDQLLEKLAEARADAKKAKKAQADAEQKVADLEKSASWPGKADDIEKPLKKDAQSASDILEQAKSIQKEMLADDRKAKTAAKEKASKLKDYLDGLQTDVANAQKALDKAQAELQTKAPEIAAFRKPLSETCDGGAAQEPPECTTLQGARIAAEQAANATESAIKAAARYDRRPSHPYSATRVKNYTVSTRGIPDPDYVQDLPYASGFFKDSESSFDLEQGGTLQGIKTSTTDHTAEFFLSILKAASGITARVMTGSGGTATDTVLKAMGDATDAEKKFIGEYLRADSGQSANTLEANFRLLPDGRRLQYVQAWTGDPKLTGNSRTALLLAKRNFLKLAGLEDAYLTLVGPGNTGAGAPATIDANRKTFDSLLSQGWGGSSQLVSWTPTYEVTPAKPTQVTSNRKDPDHLADGEAVLLFKVAQNCGVDVTGADLLPVRTPLPKPVGCAPGDPEDEKPEFKNITLAIVNVTGPTVASKAALLQSQPKDGPGLPFVVPGDAIVKMTNTGIKLVDAQVQLAQSGFVAHLPASVFNGTGGVTATYYQATGALKSITQKTSAKVTGATVDSVASAILGPLDAKLKADSAASATAQAASAADKLANDELTKWTRLQNILTARKAAQALCLELGVTPCQ